MTMLLPAFVGAPEVGKVYHTDALRLMRAMPDGYVDLIATDPPFNIGKADWDSWSSLDAYLAWLGEHLREMRRVLKPNGSLYLFCSTLYQAEVHLAVKQHFNVLSNVRWRKENGWHKKADEEIARSYFHASETVIFAEQWGADVGAANKDAELWCDLSRPMKAWFRDEAQSHGITPQQINAAIGSAQTGGGMATHYIGSGFTFELPTPEMWRRLKAAFPFAFNREYASLRREYEDLRRQYEHLRRPFFATADAPYTDVWDFATVNTYPGKHICEKPLDMCRHIVRVSSRPDAVVCDPFCGSGNMLRAAKIEGRQYIGGDADLHWAERSRERLRMPFEQRQRATVTQFDDLPLFAMNE